MSVFLNEKEKKRYMRGLIEEGFDTFLQEDMLESFLTITKIMEPLIKERKDVVVGMIFGAIWERYATSYRMQLGRVPTPTETMEIFTIIAEKIKQLSMK